MSEEKSSKQDPESSKKQLGREVRYVPVEYVDSPHTGEDEINLLDLIKVIWEGRRMILITMAIVFGVGLFVFLFSGREYESDAILIQEEQQGQSQLQLLAQQFGGLGSGGNQQPEGVIPPSLYPQVMESADFMLQVITHEVEFKETGFITTPLNYFNEYYEPPFTEKTADFLVNYTFKLPVTLYRGVLSLFSSESSNELLTSGEEEMRFLSLNREQRKAISLMLERMTLEQEGNLVTFKIQMPDARAAAELNEFVIERMQEFVIDYRIDKYRQNLEFVEKQKEDARQRYEEAQLELARFTDQNVNITTAVARTRQEELQNRRDVLFNVYNAISQEVEQARIRLQQETPVFNVLQRPRLPHSTAGRSNLLLVLSLFLGLFAGVFLVFGTQAWQTIQNSIKAAEVS